MTYRFLSIDDAKKMAKIFAENFSDGWNLDQLNGAFTTGGFYALGCYTDDLVGFITYTLVDGVADIDDVLVLPSNRRKGVGLNLVRECEKHLKSLGASKIMLEVRLGNQPAISLYKKSGFLQISTRKKYYFDGEDALVFQKELL